jgi:hypothetical protein
MHWGRVDHGSAFLKTCQEEEIMARPALRLVMIGLIGLPLFVFNLGCYSAGVVYEEPTYRHEPPPPPEPGPPPWAPAHGYRAKHQYRYFPDSHLYYDTGRRVYFYYEGGRWGTSVSLPSSIHIDVNDFVSVEMDTDEPYRYDSDIVKKYPPGQKKKKSKGKSKDRI